MTLSVVIVIASDTVRGPGRVDHLRCCLRALHEQEASPSLDIVVPHLPDVADIETLARDFPFVRFVEVAGVKRERSDGPCRAHHDQLRAAALAEVHGDLVAMLEDHEYPDAQWAAQVLAAHDRTEYAGIGGAVENSVSRPLNWAVFFCDFAHYLNPVTSGPSARATDVNVSYKRDALEVIAPVWRVRFHERLVHAALLSRGLGLALSPGIVVYQRRVGLTARDAMVERFVWGRSFAATRAERWSKGRRLLYAACSPLLPLVFVARILTAVIGKRRCQREFLGALPWIWTLAIAWSLGELVGYYTLQTTPDVVERRPVATARTL